LCYDTVGGGSSAVAVAIVGTAAARPAQGRSYSAGAGRTCWSPGHHDLRIRADQRQPTLATLLRLLLRAGGFDLRLHLAAYDPHDEILASLEESRSEDERTYRDRQLQAWRDAVPAEDVA
jgi:hypothetical protein